MVYRGVGADFEKPKKYFLLIMKKIYLENFEPLYTNKKVQLQLDFLFSPAVAGLFLLVIKVQLQLYFLISPAVAGLFD